MKINYKITNWAFCCMLILLMTNCQKLITDFGNTCTISGFLKDQSGNIVPGDITTTNLSVKALGEEDVVTTDMRVNGAGFFQNTKLFPKEYKIFVTGPVTMVEDTLNIDFSANSTIERDIIVIPFLSINKPAIVDGPTATSVNVSYEIIANGGKTVSKRQLYCSTGQYPNASTGSGAFYTTKTVTLTTNSGTASVTGLTTKTRYFIRIGAQASGATGYNFSDQIEITTQ